MRLLKLHGSINWRVRKGSGTPCSVDDILHDEDWYPAWKDTGDDYLDIRNHLENEPFIVPPVLTKSSLVREPILRLVWHLAHDELLGAKRVIFVGYSFPTTDIAARFLFTEAMILRNPVIQVINFAQDEEARALVMKSYRSILPNLADDAFDFRGAVEWAKEFASESQVTA